MSTTIKKHGIHLTYIVDSQHHNPYLNCKDPDLPFKHKDNNHHFNSRYAMGYTKPFEQTQVYFCDCTTPIFFESKHSKCWAIHPIQ
jgi:hypothetical protein